MKTGLTLHVVLKELHSPVLGLSQANKTLTVN